MAFGQWCTILSRLGCKSSYKLFLHSVLFKIQKLKEIQQLRISRVQFGNQTNLELKSNHGESQMGRILKGSQNFFPVVVMAILVIDAKYISYKPAGSKHQKLNVANFESHHKDFKCHIYAQIL